MSAYSKEQINEMREMLAELDLEALDDDDIVKLLINGCKGYKSWTDDEIIEAATELWGSESLRDSILVGVVEVLEDHRLP